MLSKIKQEENKSSLLVFPVNCSGWDSMSWFSEKTVTVFWSSSSQGPSPFIGWSYLSCKPNSLLKSSKSTWNGSFFQFKAVPVLTFQSWDQTLSMQWIHYSILSFEAMQGLNNVLIYLVLATQTVWLERWHCW